MARRHRPWSLGWSSRRTFGVLLGVALTTGLMVAGPAATAEETDPATCVSYRTQARFSIGYDHLVHVTNACERPVLCRVRTNVNQTGLDVRVAPERTETVVTFRGSPASSFSADVSCTWTS